MCEPLDDAGVRLFRSKFAGVIQSRNKIKEISLGYESLAILSLVKDWLNHDDIEFKKTILVPLGVLCFYDPDRYFISLSSAILMGRGFSSGLVDVWVSPQDYSQYLSILNGIGKRAKLMRSIDPLKFETKSLSADSLIAYGKFLEDIFSSGQKENPILMQFTGDSKKEKLMNAIKERLLKEDLTFAPLVPKEDLACGIYLAKGWQSLTQGFEYKESDSLGRLIDVGHMLPDAFFVGYIRWLEEYSWKTKSGSGFLDLSAPLRYDEKYFSLSGSFYYRPFVYLNQKVSSPCPDQLNLMIDCAKHSFEAGAKSYSTVFLQKDKEDSAGHFYSLSVFQKGKEEFEVVLINPLGGELTHDEIEVLKFICEKFKEKIPGTYSAKGIHAGIQATNMSCGYWSFWISREIADGCVDLEKTFKNLGNKEDLVQLMLRDGVQDMFCASNLISAGIKRVGGYERYVDFLLKRV